MTISQKRWLWFGTAAALLLAGAAGGLHLYYRQALDRLKVELKAKGESLRVADLVPPSRHHDPADAVLAAIHQPAFANIPVINAAPSGMRELEPGRAIACSLLTNYPNHQNDTNTWVGLGAELDLMAPELQALRTALETPAPEFSVAYGQGFSSMLLPHLVPLKRVARILAAANLRELHRHRPEAALANLRALLGLAECAADERLIISQLVRIACAHIAFNATWEALQYPSWTDAQLAELQRRWRKLHFLAPMEQSLRMERAMTVETLAAFRSYGPQALSGFLPFPGPAAPNSSLTGAELVAELGRAFAEQSRAAVGGVLWKWFWSYRDELQALRFEQVVLEAVAAARTNACRLIFDQKVAASLTELTARIQHSTADDSEPTMEGLWLLSTDALTQHSCVKKTFVTETARELAVAAIAIKRYELRHGRLPPTLEALQPEFLTEPPRDFINGQPLKYHLKADHSWLLYSVGDNARDDQGDTTPDATISSSWQRGRDWVWPRPATPEEAAAFFTPINRPQPPIRSRQPSPAP